MAAALPVFAGIAVAGTAVSAYGQLQAGNAQRDAAEFNARTAEINAAQSEAATIDQLQQLARRTRITDSKQRAGYAKAGVKREGTPLEVLTETANLADKDAYRLREQGRLAVQGFQTQAAQARHAGKVAQTNSRIGAGSTLLTGFGNTALNIFGSRLNPLAGALGT